MYHKFSLKLIFRQNVNWVYTTYSNQTVAFKGTSQDSDQVDIFGWVQLAQRSDDNCRVQDWTNEAVSSLGLDVTQYHHTLFVPNTASGCNGIVGQAYYDDRWGWVIGTRLHSTHLVSHELGHNFKFAHSGLLQCHDGNGNATFISSPNNCFNSEYGDKYELMGSGMPTPFWFSLRHRLMAKWWDESWVQYVNNSANYVICTMDAQFYQPPRKNGLIIPMKYAFLDFTHYYIEMRYANNLVPIYTAIFIRMGPPPGQIGLQTLVPTFLSSANTLYVDPFQNISLKLNLINQYCANIAVLM